jgi:hypothetical protein
MRDYIQHLEAENDRLKTHCAVAGNQIMALKRKMNTRAAKKKWKSEAQCRGTNPDLQ